IRVNRLHAASRVQPLDLRTDAFTVRFRSAHSGLPCEDRITSQPPMRKEPCSKVPGTNLTREEAAERARLVSVSTYEVELDLTTGAETFASTSTVRFAAQPATATFLDLVAPEVRETTLNARTLAPDA